MKKFMISTIKLYQKIPGEFHSYCKHVPTCSNYAIEAIDRFGAVKGGFMAFGRILRCNPFSKGGVDPVPMKEEK
jgi:putative membrane protein insertion efficiency factor